MTVAEDGAPLPSASAPTWLDEARPACGLLSAWDRR